MPSWEKRLGIAEWEPTQMTICIAAICDMQRAIIICADREFGWGTVTSTELRDGKYHQLFLHSALWSVGIADTVTHATEVIAEVRRLESQEHVNSMSVLDVKPTLEHAYANARLRRAEGLYLRSRHPSMTLDEFYKTGAKNLSPDSYSRIDLQIANFDYEASLIAAGFGEDDLGPSILTIRNPGVCDDQTKIGFWCIGSGAPAAQMSLFGREYSWTFAPEKAAYSILEAKIYAEKAAGVGPKTDLYLLRKGRAPIAIQPQTMTMMREMFSELRPRDFSSEHQVDLSNRDEFKVFADLGRP